MELHVFNRWGQEVFMTTDINEGWDGIFKGKPQPLEVYVYYLIATTLSGETIKKEGDVSLIR